MAEARSFDEIDVGLEVPGPRVEVTRAMIREFAEASFDHNPLHWDDKFLEETEFAGGKKFDDVIVHGLMTYSLMTRAMTDWLLPRDGDLWGEHRRLETRFRKPIYPGDAVEVRGRVVDKRETRKGKWVVCEIMVTNQKDQVVATGEAMAEILR